MTFLILVLVVSAIMLAPAVQQGLANAVSVIVYTVFHELDLCAAMTIPASSLYTSERECWDLCNRAAFGAICHCANYQSKCAGSM